MSDMQALNVFDQFIVPIRDHARPRPFCELRGLPFGRLATSLFQCKHMQCGQLRCLAPIWWSRQSCFGGIHRPYRLVNILVLFAAACFSTNSAFAHMRLLCRVGIHRAATVMFSFSASVTRKSSKLKMGVGMDVGIRKVPRSTV